MGPILFRRLRILLLLYLILSPAPATPAAPLPFDEYRALMGEAFATLRTEKGRIEPGQAEHLLSLFPAQLDVLNRKGQPFHVDNRAVRRWIREAESSPEGRQHLLVHLRVLSGQLSLDREESPVTGLRWEKSRNALEAIYQREEFRHLGETTPPRMETTSSGTARPSSEMAGRICGVRQDGHPGMDLLRPLWTARPGRTDRDGVDRALFRQAGLAMEATQGPGR
jgi:hypothetical protein